MTTYMAIIPTSSVFIATYEAENDQEATEKAESVSVEIAKKVHTIKNFILPSGVKKVSMEPVEIGTTVVHEIE